MNKSYIYSSYTFISLIVVISIFRLLGIWHGYPFIYNVDEPTLVKQALNLRFSPWIDRFDWPHFNYYFHYLFYFLFIKARGVIQLLPNWELIKDFAPVFWQDDFIFHVISRGINTALSLVSAIPLYRLISKITKSTMVARVSVIMYLLLPYAMVNSRYAIQDTVLMSWIAFYLYFVYLYFTSSKIKDLLLSLIFIGIAAGVKYNALIFLAILGIVIIISQLVLKRDYRKFILHSLLSAILFILIFIAVTPSILIYPYIFWSNKGGAGFLWQLNQNLRTFSIQDYFPNLFLDLEFLMHNLGIIVFLLWLLSVKYIKFLGIDKKDKIFLYLIWGFSILYTVNAARYLLSGPRFYIPIYPLVVLSASSIILLYRRHKYFQVGIVLSIVGLFANLITQAIIFTSPSSLNLAYSKYFEYSEKNVTYIKAEDMERLNLLNNLKLKTIRSNTTFNSGNYIISSREIKINGYDLELIETIDPKTGPAQTEIMLGPKIFIYKVK